MAKIECPNCGSSSVVYTAETDVFFAFFTCLYCDEIWEDGDEIWEDGGDKDGESALPLDNEQG